MGWSEPLRCRPELESREPRDGLRDGSAPDRARGVQGDRRIAEGHGESHASRISAKLAVDPRTRDVAIEVAVDGGIAAISGETRLQEVDEAVQTVAREVDGVTEVRSKVVVIPPFGG